MTASDLTNKNEMDLQMQKKIAELEKANQDLLAENMALNRDITKYKKAEDMLRESEEKYLGLFESLDEEFCIIDIIFDDAGKPVDWRYLETNPQFVNQGGSPDVAGQLVSVLYPQTEAYWFEFYGNVAVSGVPVRMENELKALNKWYDIFAFKIGGLESRKVGALFRDITERKRAEEAVRESEEQYRTLFQSMDEGFAIAEMEFDLEGKPVDYVILEINQAYERQAGLRPEKVIGRRVTEFLDMVEPVWFERYGRVVSSGEPQRFEEYNVSLDRWFSVYAFPLPIKNRLGIIFKDITERKSAEEALQESKARIESIFRSSPVGIGVVVNRMIREVNEKLCKMTGYSKEELLGKSARILYPTSEESERVGLVKYDMIEDHGTGYVETRWQRKDGSVVDILLSSSPIVPGNLSGEIIFTALDITERKRAEEELRESEEKYRRIVETAQEGIWLIDQNDRTVFVNQKMSDMLGFSIDEIIGQSPQKFMAPEFRIEAEDRLHEHMQGTKHVIDYRFIRKDGSNLWCILSSSPLFDDQGKYSGSLSMITDITERKQAEEALKIANETLEARVQERTDELEKAYKYLRKVETVRKQEIHHRIKNNLQVISSLLDLQAEKFRGKKNIADSQVLEAFKESQDRVISMALVHEELHKGGEVDTLNFSKYIEELAENLFFTYRFRSNDINLDTDIEEDVFFDMDTSVPLGIIINELVSNSLKHAFSGKDKGEIQIKFHGEKNRECEIESNKSTTFFLSVSDNGVGIPENLDIEEIDSLGLQLVTSLVDQLDGKLELKRDKGTEFNIRFTVEEKVI